MEVLHEKPDAPERRRLQLLLKLGSTTGLRLSELTTTRMKGFRRELVNGGGAGVAAGRYWQRRKAANGDGIRRHQVPRRAAPPGHGRGWCGVDARVARVQSPNSLPTTAAGERMGASGRDSDGTAVEVTGNALQYTLREEHLNA